MKTLFAVVAVVALCLTPSLVRASVYCFPDAELLNFVEQDWSTGSLEPGYPQDIAGPGVRFMATLGSKTAFGDNWPIEPDAGLGSDGGHNNVSIDAWDGIKMPVRYVAGSGDIQVRLFMNTGLTGPSGTPKNDWTNDTFWQGPLTTMSVGDVGTLHLDFSNAEVWNAADNKSPHSGAGEDWINGTWHAINERDLNEVTNLGFEIIGPSGQQITLDVNIIPEPATIAIWSLLAMAGVCLITWRRR